MVDSFGICSFEDPVQVLKEIDRVLKPGGRVMLLEHGESHNVAMSLYQKWRAESHLRKWGCYWDRPILALVSSSPLIIDEHSSH
ncbi:MAG: methyltransferase domain-containing protein, partial [archaeon]|nr:methyltransferase domain-containing protein [archaeon]